MITLSPTGLRQTEDADAVASVKTNENFNITRLNNQILGLSYSPGLADTQSMDNPSDGDVMIWNASGQYYTLRVLTTTTTTTTSTTA
jgi:hypothetical protein